MSGLPRLDYRKDQRSIDLKDFIPPDRCVLIVGSEAYDIASRLRECCDQMVKIPMSRFKNSKNLNQALAIVAYNLISKMGRD